MVLKPSMIGIHGIFIYAFTLIAGIVLLNSTS